MAPRPIQTQPDEGRVVDTGPNAPPPSASLRPVDFTVSNAPYAALSDLAGQIGDMAEKAMIPGMEDKGAQAVTRDPGTGELQVQTRTPLNNLDVAYNHGAMSAFAAQSAGDRRAALQQMAIDNLDDPNKFRDLATQYVKTQAGGAGVPTGLRGDILSTGMEDVAQFTQNLVTKKQQRDTRNQLKAITDESERQRNDVLALAHNGGTDTPEFQAAIAKYRNVLGALRNPIFGIPQQELDDRVNELGTDARGEAAVGHALELAKTAGPVAAVQFLDKAAWDPSISMSPAQRSSLVQRGHREIMEFTAVQRDADNQLKQVVVNRLDDAMARARATGDYSPVIKDDEIYSAYKDDPAKAADIVSALHGAQTEYSTKKQVALATPQALVAMEAGLNPATGKPPQIGFDSFYRGFLAPHEGGYTASDGNGQPANFGINQGANPDVDVKNLTQDQAKQILHDRYWVASGADALPPQLAAVVGDTAVNMGVQKSKDLLAQSGGDVQKYLNLRETAYKAIAQADPTKAANLPEWLKRTEDLRSYVAGGDYADMARDHQIFLKAVQERNQQLVHDSAGYVASARPDIASELQSNNPAKVQLGVRSLIQQQQDLGVNNPRILSNGQVQQIVSAFSNPPDPTKRADFMNTQINQLAQTYGDYFPQVMKELQAKGMPPEASALYAVRGMGVQSVRMATAITSMSHMGKDINAGRDAYFKGAPNNGEIGKAIPGVMSDYAGTLVGNPDGPQTLQTTNYAVALYARQLAYEGVTDPNKAAQQAHDDLLGSRYSFVDNYRVPRGVDSALIQSGANAVKASLPASNLEPYANAAPGVSVDDRRAMSAKILSGQGVWLTRSDDKGLYLAWPQKSGYMPAIDAKGRPLSFSWAALQAAGHKPSTVNQVLQFRADEEGH